MTAQEQIDQRKDAGQQQTWQQVALLGTAPFIAGCCSGVIATVVIQPIDTLKVRMQLMQQQKSTVPLSSIRLVKDLMAHRRLTELYNGLSAGMLRVMVYGTARIGLFSTFEGLLQQRARERGTTLGFGGRTLAGLSAGALAAIIGNPTEVALIRMQADGAKPIAEQAHYTSSINALRRITRMEGVVALWKGTAPTVARAMSTNFGQLAFFSEAKHQLQLRTKLSEQSRSAAAAAIGGFAGAFISQPFDFVKTRLQSQTLNPSAQLPCQYLYKGTIDCFMKVARTEGLARFYRDFWPYFWRVIPQSVITLYLTDHLLRMLRA